MAWWCGNKAYVLNGVIDCDRLTRASTLRHDIFIRHNKISLWRRVVELGIYPSATEWREYIVICIVYIEVDPIVNFGIIWRDIKPNAQIFGIPGIDGEAITL